MKLVVLMWILSLSDLSSEIIPYEGTLNECLLTSILYNERQSIKYAGCFIIAKQNSYTQKE